MLMPEQQSMASRPPFTAIGTLPFSRWRCRKSLPNGLGFSVVVFLVGMILLFGAVGLAMKALGPDTYSGVDGKFNQDLITTYLSFGRPFEVNTVNPLEGVFSQLYPLNIWLNPGFVQFLIFDHDTALVASTAVFLFIYCLSIYALARTVGASNGVAVVGAQLGAFVFPPLYRLSGLFSNYDLMPGAALTVALFTLLLCVILRLRDASWHNFAIAVMLSTPLIGYIVFNDPLTMGVIAFSCLVPFGVAILEGRRAAVIGLRLLVLAVAAAIIYALGLVDYVLAIGHYTARYYFRHEFYRPQVPDFVSTLFVFPNAGATYAFLIPGWLAGLLLCRDPQRSIPAMATLNFVWILIYGSAYLFSGFHWFAPLPIYIEEYTIHIAGLGAVIGWAALLRRIIGLGSPASWRRFGRPPLKFVATLGAAAILPILVAIYSLRVPAWMYGLNHDPWADEPELVNYLGDRIGLRDGREFRGTVYVNVIGHRDQQTYVNLWHNSIPTFNEYGQALTPAYEFFRTRLLIETRPDTEHLKGLFSPERQYVVGRINIPGLEAVGTRFLLSADPPGEGSIASGDPPTILRGEFRGRIPGVLVPDRKWYLYELANPNQGQFSPTAVRVATTAPVMLEAMRMPEFDWNHEVFLTEPLNQTLTTARNVRMIIRRGSVELQAETEGPALLVLPIQYSHCLALAGDPDARLVRANFLLTGIVFTKPIHATIYFNYGFFNAACRRADNRDMEVMQVTGYKDMGVSQRDQNPYAITSLRMIRVKVREALAHLKFL
jgi:hypothetical protein